MKIRSLVAVFASAFVTLALAGGCNKSQEAKTITNPAPAKAHDADDVPITEADVKMPANYGDAVARIRSYRDTIRGAIEAGTPTKAHRSLDELDIVLNKLPSIARDSNVPKEKWETVTTASRELRDLFNQVHSAIDENRTPDYGAVAKPIDAAIDRLAALIPGRRSNP